MCSYHHRSAWVQSYKFPPSCVVVVTQRFNDNLFTPPHPRKQHFHQWVRVCFQKNNLLNQNTPASIPHWYPVYDPFIRLRVPPPTTPVMLHNNPGTKQHQFSSVGGGVGGFRCVSVWTCHRVCERKTSIKADRKKKKKKGPGPIQLLVYCSMLYKFLRKYCMKLGRWWWWGAGGGGVAGWLQRGQRETKDKRVRDQYG